MRLVVFEKNKTRCLGLLEGTDIIDLAAAGIDAEADVSELLRRGGGAFTEITGLSAERRSQARIPLSSVPLLPPSMRPAKVICLGLNYISHASEVGRSNKPDYPAVFFRTPSSFIGATADLVLPKVSAQLDWGGGLVAFIGRSGRHIPRETALSHVAGYSVFNDGSVRDYQLRTSQWTVGKNFDGTGPFGPAFVSADELPPGAAGLKIETRVNGQVMQSSDTGQMIFDVAETITLLSQCFTLEAGDLLVMGTPSGVGNARDPKIFLKAGDVCEVEIERIGLLSNAVVEEV